MLFSLLDLSLKQTMEPYEPQANQISAEKKKFMFLVKSSVIQVLWKQVYLNFKTR